MTHVCETNVYNVPFHISATMMILPFFSKQNSKNQKSSKTSNN